VTTAEDERAGTVEGIEKRNTLMTNSAREDRRDEEERSKQEEGCGTSAIPSFCS
jgi:hypothetical protein